MHLSYFGFHLVCCSLGSSLASRLLSLFLLLPGSFLVDQHPPCPHLYMVVSFFLLGLKCSASDGTMVPHLASFHLDSRVCCCGLHVESFSPRLIPLPPGTLEHRLDLLVSLGEVLLVPLDHQTWNLSSWFRFLPSFCEAFRLRDLWPLFYDYTIHPLTSITHHTTN